MMKDDKDADSGALHRKKHWCTMRMRMTKMTLKMMAATMTGRRWG